jgi:sensor histidine kinase YesM
MFKRSFFSKVFFHMSFVACLGTITVYYAAQYSFKHILMDNELNRIQKSVEQSSLNIDLRMDQIVKDMFHFIAYSDKGVELLGAVVDPVELTESMKKAAKDLGDFRHRYPDEIESAFFYRDDDIFFHVYSLSLIHGLDYRTQEWYAMFENHDRQVRSEPTNSVMFHQDTPDTTLFLAMGIHKRGTFSDKLEHEGIFVVRMNPDWFEAMFKHLANEEVRVSLYTDQGGLIYTSRKSSAPENHEEWLTLETELVESGMRSVVYVHKNSIVDKVNEIKTVNIYIIALILVLAFLLSSILSAQLTRPIRKLLQLMKSVEKGDFSVRFAVKRHDEISRLGVGFNHMLLRVSDLIEQVYLIRLDKIKSELRQKEATIKALQSQINPHFLYNTLEAINCHAIVHQVPSVSKVSKALADFFRYSIEKQEIVVPLFKEIEHMNTYIRIQEERFPHIQVNIEIPEALYTLPIIKLSLQPLVENAFVHAFNGDKALYWIRIRGERQNGSYTVTVEDNGDGISEEGLHKLRDAVEQELPPSQGIGLNNVHHRLRMQFGAAYGLSIDHSGESGFAVTVRCPADEPWQNGGDSYESVAR